MLDSYIKLIKAHENILAIAALAFIGWTVSGKLLDKRADAANQRLGAATQVVTAQDTQNKDLAAQLAAQQKEYAALQLQTSRQVAQLAAAIAARDTTEKRQVQVDQTLPPADLASRWEKLMDLGQGDVAPAPNDSYLVKDPAARATVENLENVKTLFDDDQDKTKINAEQQAQLADLQKTADLYTKQTMGLQAELDDQKKACVAQVSQVKAAAAKSKRSWFLRGLVIGAAIVGYVLR